MVGQQHLRIVRTLVAGQILGTAVEIAVVIEVVIVEVVVVEHRTFV